MDVFLDLWKKNPRTAVLVTHDPDEAAYIASRAVVIREGGAIAADVVSPTADRLREELMK